MTYYLDNFRGFQNTHIDLMNINFFVGENSSGKTSLINALAIMSDSRFFFDGEIPFGIIDYKYFDDFCSVHNTKDYFTLGIINDGAMHLYSYKNDDGLPILFREIFYTYHQILFALELDGINIMYNFSTNISNINDAEDLLKFFDSDKPREMKYCDEKADSKQNSPWSFRFARNKLQQSKKEIEVFFSTVVNDFFCSSANRIPISSLAPIRARPEPIYTGGKKPFSAEGEHIPYMLKEMLASTNGERNLIQMLYDYGKESGLFDSIDVKQYGDEKTAPFELLIKRANSNYKISSIGYGVSQILPIITEMLKHTNGTIAVQQPEVHLHPKAQAAFGAFLYAIFATRKGRSEYIVETHSDYIIDRFRYQMKESTEETRAQVLFFKNDGKHNLVTPIYILNDGKYFVDENFYEFRSFFIDESFKAMEI